MSTFSIFSIYNVLLMYQVNTVPKFLSNIGKIICKLVFHQVRRHDKCFDIDVWGVYAIQNTD